MEKLEPKNINGNIYYYYSKWQWDDGRCRRIWQRYLGRPRDIASAVLAGGPPPLCAVLFDWGLPSAFWLQSRRANLIDSIDRLCPKRRQGLSPGTYITIAAINRAIAPVSKNSLWEWFSQTVLLRYLPHVSKDALASQRFWDHMGRIKPKTALDIWKAVLKHVISTEKIDLSSISYDGTNFYTFIDTFNSRCKIAKRGKNEQGRCNLGQISYALFCCSDGQLPLYYELYVGNRNDTKQFPIMLAHFKAFLNELTGHDSSFDTTVIFDKGNNSEANFALVDFLKLHFVGSIKLDQQKTLAQISNSSDRFKPCKSPALECAKAFRVNREVFGKKRTLVVVYNTNLYDTQWLTLHNDVGKAVEKLSAIRQRLLDRANGLIKGGRAPTIRAFICQSWPSVLLRLRRNPWGKAWKVSFYHVRLMSMLLAGTSRCKAISLHIHLSMSRLMLSISDTLMEVGSEAYAAALVVYRTTKQEGLDEGLEPYVDDMAKRFALKSSSTTESDEATSETRSE